MNRRLFASVGLVASVTLLIGSFTNHLSAKDFPAGSPKFETKYKSALSEAKKSGKPVLLVFSATWCGPCQVNKKNVYPADAVKPYHDKFVWAYLDADEKDNEKPMQEFQVNGIPHIQFLDKDGKAIDSVIGGTRPEEFAKKLEQVLKKVGAAQPATPAAPEKK